MSESIFTNWAAAASNDDVLWRQQGNLYREYRTVDLWSFARIGDTRITINEDDSVTVEWTQPSEYSHFSETISATYYAVK